MPEFEISWEIHLSKNNPGPLIPPKQSDLLAVYPSIVERFALMSVSTDGGRSGVINISQRTSAGNARTAALYIRSGNPFTSDAGIAHILGDATIDAVVSDLTVTDTESGVVALHDKGQYRPDDSDLKPEPEPAARRIRGRPRRAVAEEVVAEEVVAEEVVAEEVVAEEPEIRGIGL